MIKINVTMIHGHHEDLGFVRKEKRDKEFNLIPKSLADIQPLHLSKKSRERGRIFTKCNVNPHLSLHLILFMF